MLPWNEICKNSLRRARTYGPQKHDDIARTMKKMNSRLINRALNVQGTPEVRYESEIIMLFDYFVWLFPSCKDATDIMDMYNASHVAGILFCKSVFMNQDDNESEHEEKTVRDWMPELPELHASDEPIERLDIEALMLLTATVQHFWVRTVHHANACNLLFAMAARMGAFLIVTSEVSSKLPDYVEAVANRENVFRVKKKTVRTFMCSLLVLFRNLVMEQCKVCIDMCSMAEDEKNSFLRVQKYGESSREEFGLCERIHRCILCVKRLRNEGSHTDGAVTMQREHLWKYISSRMPEDAIGQPPRKISDDMQHLLRSVFVFQEAANSYFARGICLDECAFVVETALKFFYISPAVETYKRLSLLCDISPGQRLSYSFDFVHFDTGNISQVVYLHNPLYKQTPPPQCIDDWDSQDVCGPISAFLQFDPTIEIWLDDSEDPLGLLGHTHQILRPADHNNDEKKNGDAVAPAQQYAFVLNKCGLYLVDRHTAQIFSTAPIENSKHHHVLYLLCYYLYLTNKIQEVCRVAINSLKVCSNLHAAETL